MKKHLIISFSLLIIVFSSSNAFSQISQCYNWVVDGYGYSELLHDDQALTVSGIAGTEFIVFDYTPPYCDHDFDAWVYSELANSSGILSRGRLDSPSWSVEGRHGTFNAQYRRYCVTSEHGFVDYWSYFDGKVYYSFTDEYTRAYTQECYTFTPPPTPTPTPSPSPTPNVISVTFSQVTPSTEGITRNPAVAPHNPGIGERIFPDDDTPQDGVDRRLVRVTASLSQPIPNVPVYFRNFDLDDPATDTTIDINGTAGDDNSGTPTAGQLLFANGCGANGASVFCPTDASGVATIVFVVTRQPGNNFAIAAGLTPAEVNAVNINGIELTNGSGQMIPTSCPTQSVCRSEMLTVWRRLHIEVDSMGNSIQNRAIGTIPATTKFRFGETKTVTLNPTSPATLEPNRFDGGRLYVNFRSFAVTCDLSMGQTCNTATTVTVRNTGAAVTLFADTPFELYDDDDFNDNNGTALNGDTGEDIPGPDDPAVNATSLMQPNDVLCSQTITSGCNVFASSYVRPIYDITTDGSDNTIFQPNIESDDFIPDPVRDVFRADFDQQATEGDAEFWTIYLYGSYQQNLDRDADPADEDGVMNPNGCPDASYGVVDDLGPIGWGAAIHMEVGRPREYPSNYLNRPVSHAWTAAHEVGHLFGGSHDDTGIMTPTCTRTEYEYDPETIRRLRATMVNP
jgi:hypothetical protein